MPSCHGPRRRLPQPPNPAEGPDPVGSQQPPFLRLENFSLGVPAQGSGLSGGAKELLRDVELEIPAGGLIVFAGPSGAGKSTLMRLVCGLRHPREPKLRVRGRAQVLGHGLKGRGTSLAKPLAGRVTAVLQEEGLLDELTPRENVELALKRSGQSPRLALALLAQVGLDPPPAQVHTLSGGQRKRVAVARGLATAPDVFLLDEPTAGLDAQSAREIATLLMQACRDRDERTVLVVTHDLNAFEGLADGVLWLDGSNRQLRFVGTPRGEVEEVIEKLTQGSSRELQGGPAEAVAAVPAGGGGFAALGPLLPTGWFGDLTFAMAKTAAALVSLEPARVGRELLRCVLAPAAFTAAGCGILGGLATFFALRNNPLEGAFQGAVLAGTGKVLVAVLVPLIAGFFFTARVVAEAAARLAAMQRTRQLDALRILGVPPERWLLGPFAWGMFLGLPLVTGAAVVAAAAGALAAAHLAVGVGGYSWAVAFTQDLGVGDLVAVLAKGLGSALLVTGITWSLATGPKASGAAVGEAASRSIVVGMAAVLLVHGAGVLAQFL